MNLRKCYPFKIFNNSIYDIAVPGNLNIWWNFGSILGLCLIIQLVTGIYLAMHYVADADTAFITVYFHIHRNLNWGWLWRFTHINGVSMFFVCIYIHIGRGLYYGSYKNAAVWYTGVILLFLLMGTAFLGYVLPWGQLSYWGATVISNFVTIIPVVGYKAAMWIWGDWVVGAPVLVRFFTLHFILPFVMVFLVLVHLMFLHETGSNNPLGVYIEADLVPFHVYYTLNDLAGFCVFGMVFSIILFWYPQISLESINYDHADDMETPAGVVPEWYFMVFYTILEGIPNKVGGVLALFAAIFVLLLVPTFHNHDEMVSMAIYPISQVLFWSFVGNFYVMTRLGYVKIDNEYITGARAGTVFYFLYFPLVPLTMKFWDRVVFWT